MKNYYQANRERFLSELFELLRIPSISSDPAHKDDMYACARKLTSLLKEAGAPCSRRPARTEPRYMRRRGIP